MRVATAVTKPPILLYTRRDGTYMLGALEWVFPTCHYEDGNFVPAPSEDDCEATHDGSKFFFWHPDLVTLHVWLWHHNPDGLYEGMNPLVKPFNKG